MIDSKFQKLLGVIRFAICNLIKIKKLSQLFTVFNINLYFLGDYWGL